jgi:phosphoribosylaminoimidazole-succinocarboxamide synthase
MEKIAQPFYNFQNQTNFYRGKVRDVYSIGDDKLVMIASNRISAFDIILPKEIPHKGQVLNQIAFHHLNQTKDIIPNWVLSSPLPYVTVGYKCVPYKVELVVRGYLAGHAARTYKSGKRELCGVTMPEGMVENQKFPTPIITPTTKADYGHDVDISRAEIISQSIVSETHYEQLEKYSLALYQRGVELASKQGLILVDTKYEFGLYNGEITLMDEIHTPDSSRYFVQEGFEHCIANNIPPKQLSKEFVRQWLMENNFAGKEGQEVPEMTNEIVNSISERYIELYEKITGVDFHKETVIDDQKLVNVIDAEIEICLNNLK